MISSFCLTEPDAGSDAASLKNQCSKRWRFLCVKRHQTFITNAPHAGVFTVMARTNFDIKGAGGISAFIVDSQTPGISLGKAIKKWGKKGTYL
ncbi:acyl-CoA dehydrogenase family protein [Acinetobacter baumannii]